MNELRALEDLSIAQLRLFVRVIELANFSAAAREARVSQPAASRAVAAIEARLGAPVLARSTRKTAPTPLGERLARELKPLLDAFSGVEVAPAPEGLQGLLRVGAPSAFGRAFVVPAVNAFLLANPRVDLALLLSDRRVDLLEQRVDVSIRLGAPPSGARARTIGASEVLVVCAPMLATGAAGKTLAELVRLPAVLHGGGARALGVSPKDLRVRLECDDLDAAFEAAVVGVGVTMLPRWRCQAALESGALVRLLGSLSLPKVPVRAVFPGTKRPGRLTRAFVDTLVRSLPPALMR
jgi:DNA-binding transcriptional LysR family regulator